MLTRQILRPACLELVPLYAATNDMDAAEFAAFTCPTNLAAQILLVHFWALTCVLERHVFGASGRAFGVRDDIVRRWVEQAARRMPASHRQYVVWPLGMMRDRGAGAIDSPGARIHRVS